MHNSTVSGKIECIIHCNAKEKKRFSFQYSQTQRCTKSFRSSLTGHHPLNWNLPSIPYCRKASPSQTNYVWPCEWCSLFWVISSRLSSNNSFSPDFVQLWGIFLKVTLCKVLNILNQITHGRHSFCTIYWLRLLLVSLPGLQMSCFISHCLTFWRHKFAKVWSQTNSFIFAAVLYRSSISRAILLRTLLCAAKSAFFKHWSISSILNVPSSHFFANF